MIRWKQLGHVAEPAVFIPHLEDTGKIIEVGAWVVRTACEQIWDWQNKGHNTRISVNVSSTQLQDRGFAEMVLDSVQDFSLIAGCLNLEVQGTQSFRSDANTSHNLRVLSTSGIGLSIDFGAGCPPLADLTQLPITRLKIDRSFIRDYPSHDDGAIAAAIVTLAKRMGLEVIAEGVETDAQLNFINELGCDSFQGMLFSGPLDTQQCISVLKEDTQVIASSSVADPVAHLGD